MEQRTGTAEMEKEATAVPVEDDPSTPTGLLLRFWQWQFAGPLGRVDQEAQATMASEAGRAADRKVIIVLLTVALCLTTLRYIRMGDVLAQGLSLVATVTGSSNLTSWSERVEQAAHTPIGHLFFWCLGCLLTYLVIPILVVRLFLRERLQDYGLKLQGAFAGFWLYALMLLVMLPLVYLVSADHHFQQTYPFYPLSSGEALWPTFWCWEVLYAMQFFALEFFFRGFILHGTRHRFGVHAVFVMMVPYCMIHFGKPMPEALAAIVAGIVLGFMSLKTRSIWLGAAIHVTVAWSMDFASLWRKGILG